MIVYYSIQGICPLLEAVSKSEEANKRGKKCSTNQRQEEDFGAWSEETASNIGDGKGTGRYCEGRCWGGKRSIEIIKIIK